MGLPTGWVVEECYRSSTGLSTIRGPLFFPAVAVAVVGAAAGLALLVRAWKREADSSRRFTLMVFMAGVALAETLRDAVPGLRLGVHSGGGSFKSQFKKADRSGARYALVLGDAEVDRREVGIKPLREHREQETVSFDALATRVAHLLELV